jgi:exodeoxyribonuclease VII small subunit
MDNIDNNRVNVAKLIQTNDPESLIAELSFEEALGLLESLCTTIEGGNMSLDHAVLSYERGVVLLENLRSRLAIAESKIRLVNGEEL